MPDGGKGDAVGGSNSKDSDPEEAGHGDAWGLELIKPREW